MIKLIDILNEALNQQQIVDIAKEFMESNSYNKSHDCKRSTYEFVNWLKTNKDFEPEVLLLAPPKDIKKFPGKSGEGDAHIFTIINGLGVDFTANQFPGVSEPLKITPENQIPTEYKKIGGYYTLYPDWFEDGKTSVKAKFNNLPQWVLKKDFKEKDVQRLRNLVQGKYGEKSRSSVGFSKVEEFHNEGDIWESDGRTWTIKDGIKQNLTKFDKAKKYHVMPLLCPVCTKIMKNRNDKPFYNIHKMCFNCVIDMEVKLRKEGKWEEYENNIHNSEIDNKIQEYKLWIEEKLSESNSSFVSEDGDVENWTGKINRELVDKSVEETVKYLESLKR